MFKYVNNNFSNCVVSKLTVLHGKTNTKVVKTPTQVLTNNIINNIPSNLKPHFINIVKLIQGIPTLSKSIIIYNYTKNKILKNNQYHNNKYHITTSIKGYHQYQPKIKLSSYNKMFLKQVILFIKTC